jgi:flagellar capping protein FliD
MTVTREAWTDERLDDLNTRVDDGFARMEGRFDKMDARFDKMDARFDKMDARFDALMRTMIQGGVVVIAALIGLIATQL